VLHCSEGSSGLQRIVPPDAGLDVAPGIGCLDRLALIRCESPGSGNLAAGARERQLRLSHRLTQEPPRYGEE
jgi:hypothetical protein